MYNPRSPQSSKISLDQIDFMSLIGDIDANSTSLIGQQQLSQINSLQVQVDSLKNQLNEKDEEIALLKNQRRSRNASINTSIITRIIRSLLESIKNKDTKLAERLQEIDREPDTNKKIEKILLFLEAYAQSNASSVTRLCGQLYDHVEFIEQLSSGQYQSLAISSPKALQKLMLAQAEKTNQFLSSFPQSNEAILPKISDILNLEFNPQSRFTEISNFIKGSNNIPYEELKAMLLQEIAVVDVLRSYAQTSHQNQQNVDLDEIRNQLEDEIRQKNANEFAQREKEINEDAERRLQKSMSQFKDKISKEIKAQTEEELRPILMEEIRAIVDDEKNAQDEQETREKIEDDVRKELIVKLRPEIEKQLKQQLTSQLRPQIEQQIKEDMKEELYSSFRSQVEGELTPQIEQRYNQNMNLELEKLKRQNKQKEEELRAQIKSELTPQIHDSLQTEMKEQLKPEIENELRPIIRAQVRSSLKPEIENELRPQIESRLRNQIVEELLLAIKNQSKPEVDGDSNTSIPEKISRAINELKTQLRAELDNTLRSEIESSLRRNIEEETTERLRNEYNNEYKKLRNQIENELINNEGLRSQIASELQESIEAQQRQNMSKYSSLSDQHLASASSLYQKLCNALGIPPTEFRFDDFLSSVSSLINEFIEIRKHFNWNSGQIIRHITELQHQVQHLDQLHTQTRALLVRQSQIIADLRQQTGTASWVSWANRVYELIFGKNVEIINDIPELRLSIEEGIASAVAHEEMWKQNQNLCSDASPPRETKKSHKKGVFAFSE